MWHNVQEHELALSLSCPSVKVLRHREGLTACTLLICFRKVDAPQLDAFLLLPLVSARCRDVDTHGV